LRLAPLRICLVYDCLFPHTVGGAEHWYRNLAERLQAEGHDVTYLTLLQWDRAHGPGVPGVHVRAVGPRMPLYTRGRRRILPPLVFGAGVLWHLLRHGRRYDAVHTASFPYFSVLAAAVARLVGRYELVVDWLEVWSRGYWREYLGRAGSVGWLVQGLCARVRQRAFCFSRLNEHRLRAAGLRSEPTLLAGIYAGPLARPRPQPARLAAVFAGRHIPEKNAPALVPAIAEARRMIPELTADVFGDGPDRAEVERLVRVHELDGAVRVHGFAPHEDVEAALCRGLCMVLPSRREGYGLIVVEAAAKGVPSVVVAGDDNAATELVEEGENGTFAASASPRDLAAAIVRIHEAGPELRDRTAAWFERNASRLSLECSVGLVVESYRH